MNKKKKKSFFVTKFLPILPLNCKSQLKLCKNIKRCENIL